MSIEQNGDAPFPSAESDAANLIGRASTVISDLQSGGSKGGIVDDPDVGSSYYMLTPTGAAAFNGIGHGVTPDAGTAPIVTAGGTVTYDGGGSPVVLDPGLTCTGGPEGRDESATVSIQGFVFGDTLNFTNQGGITGSYDPDTGVLTLSNLANATTYQTALESITYSFNPVNGDPTDGGSDATRTIDWQVTSGQLISSNTA